MRLSVLDVGSNTVHLLLLDVNPLDLQGDSRDQADAVRRLRPRLTMVAGRVVHTR